MPEQTGAVAKFSLGIFDQSYQFQPQMKGCQYSLRKILNSWMRFYKEDITERPKEGNTYKLVI